MQFLDIREAGFAEKFAALVERSEESGREVEEVVQGIIAQVRSRGDEALLEYTRRFDRLECGAGGLEVTPEEFDAAFAPPSLSYNSCVEPTVQTDKCGVCVTYDDTNNPPAPVV